MSSAPRAEHPPPDGTKLAVCVSTYRRPAGLEKLLAHLATQDGIADCPLQVVVVDNDCHLSAHPVVESAPREKLAILYAHEPVPGIPRTRNRSVELAIESGATHLCFIDDDEFPAATWLAHLLAHAGATQTPIVAGPVSPILPADAPRWLEGSYLFSRRRHRTGERLSRAATGNALVLRRVFEGMDQWFDESMALTGGEDSDFFRRALRAGFGIEWCDEAVVYEDVHRERCNLRWIARRNLREALGSAWFTRKYGGRRASLKILARGSFYVARGLTLSLLTLGLIPAQRLRLVESLSSGVGLLLGRFGITIEEYRRQPGERRLREEGSPREPSPR